MATGKPVLIVSNDITDDEVQQIKSAFRGHSGEGFQLSLVYVIPRMPTCYFNIPSMGVIIEKYYADGKISLSAIGRTLSIEKKDQWLISGKIRTEVLRLANKLHSSFILAGEQQIKNLQHSLFFKNIYQITSPVLTP